MKQVFSRAISSFVILFLLTMSASFGLVIPAQGQSLSGSWEAGFWAAGPNGQVRAMVDFQDQVVVGGQFTQCGPGAASRIAIYDDSQLGPLRWRPMAEGFGGTVMALAVHADELFAGGYLGNSGSTEVGSLARWDGDDWQPVSDSLEGTPLQLVSGNDALYILTDHEDQRFVHRWAGSELERFAEADSTIRGLEFDGQDLWLHGDFQEVNGVPAEYLAFWDGSIIHPGPQGLSEPVQDLVFLDSFPVALGPFSIQGHYGDSAVVRWTGSVWEPVGNLQLSNRTLKDLVAHQGELYLNDSRYTSWETPQRAELHRLVDNDWQFHCPSFGNASINTVFSGADGLWLGGRNLASEGVAGLNLALWSENQQGWESLFEGAKSCNGDINALAVFENQLIVGGIFSSAGDEWSPQRARFDGSQWYPMDHFDVGFLYEDYWTWQGYGGLGGTTHLQTVGSHLICSGDFSENWWDYFHGIWDDENQQWLFLDDWWVFASLMFEESVVETGGYPSEIRWRTGFESEPYRVDEVDGSIIELLQWRGSLVAVGSFSSIGGFPVENLAVFSDGIWSGIGGVESAWLLSGLAYDNKLFVGGYISSAGGNPVSNIAVWDGENWEGLDSGTNGPVQVMIESHGYLIAGGDFGVAGGIESSAVAAWKDGQWSALDGGVNGIVYALANFEGDLFLGGEFSAAGGVRSDNLACWRFNEGVAPVQDSSGADSISLTISPNPANPRTEIRFVLNQNEIVQLRVFDIRGHLIRDFSPGVLDTGEHRWVWNGNDDHGQAVASGVYFVKLEAGTTQLNQKVLFVR